MEFFAEPTTFGLKMLGKYFEFKRSYERFIEAEKNISVCAIWSSWNICKH